MYPGIVANIPKLHLYVRKFSNFRTLPLLPTMYEAALTKLLS